QTTTTIPTIPAKALTLVKSASPTTYSQVGQVITYTYVITNSGSSTLGPAQFTITDPFINNNLPFNCGSADTTLASNATVTCSATYTIIQADVNFPSIETTAIAQGGDAPPSPVAKVTLTKDTATQSNLTVGSTVQHKVIEGEWLWQIARCYGADPKKVVEANSQLSNPAMIKRDTIVTVPNIGSVGKIYAPLPCISRHTVQSGDTWSSIATQYGANATILQLANSNTLTVGKVVIVPLYSGGVAVAPTGNAGTCVDLTRSVKLTGTDAGITHFNVCGTLDASGRMKIGTIKIQQRPEDVGLGGLLQDITLPATVITSTAINDANSFIVGDMNYDGNDDFRIVEFLPAGANIPYLYYIYDPATRNFIFNEAYRKITSPEFIGNNEIRSQWRESATKWGIDTYTVANNTPTLTKRETWEAIADTTTARHIVTTFNADGTSQVTIDETVPVPIP
ncbi:MAG: LysM peptidoglycan-binding domain-containing protein, partial [Anaerolineales bacterium]|nr:LysM peptidoglycan-binding domain-containing protein [Anaerolineales bacterium]